MKILKQVILGSILWTTTSIVSNAQDSQYKGHHGLDFSVELGPDFGLQSGGSTQFHALIEGGKKFNQYFYVGAGAGVETGGGITNWPIFGTLRTFMPLSTSHVIPTIGLRGGYAFGGDVPFVSLMLGAVFPVSPIFDITAGLEYQASFASGNTGHSLGIHVGLGLHRSNNYRKKPWAPTRTNGLQYVIDGGLRYHFRGDWGKGFGSTNVLAMYKWDKNLSFGAGLGYSLGRFGGEWKHSYSSGSDADFMGITVLLRGKYSLNDHKVSPFASLDLGTRFLFADSDDKECLEEYENIKTKSNVLFITPAVGLSFKVAGNSYIDCKLGYELSSSPLKGYNGNKITQTSASGLYFGLSFTHTMKFMSH